MTAILKRSVAMPLIMFVSASALPSTGFAQSAPAKASAPATAADIEPGALVRDSKGVQVARIVETQGANVVLDTGQTKIAVPMNLLAKDSQGAMLTITADQFNGAIAKAHARSEAAKAAQQATSQAPQKTPPRH